MAGTEGKRVSKNESGGMAVVCRPRGSGESLALNRSNRTGGRTLRGRRVSQPEVHPTRQREGTGKVYCLAVATYS